MLPAYVGYLGSTAARSVAAENGRRELVAHALALIAGIVSVVVGLGLVAAVAAHLFQGVMVYLDVLGGAVLLVVGLDRLGVLRTGWSAQRLRGTRGDGGGGLKGSYVTGLGLAMGFQVTLLLALGLVADARASIGTLALRLLVYALGFASMFFVTFFFSEALGGLVRRFQRSLVWVDRVAGVLTIAVAVLMIVNDGNLLKDIAFWKTGPMITQLLAGPR